MFEGCVRIASDHQIDQKRIENLIKIAATTADLKLEPRKEILKAIEKAVSEQIDKWKKLNTAISKYDITKASKELIKNVNKEFERDEIDITVKDVRQGENVEKLKEKYLESIILDVFVGYLEGGALKTSSEETELTFASEKEALQYLSDFTGQKIIVEE